MEAVVNPSPAFWAGKRVLLTGHTGFKGSWLWQWLKVLGARPFGIALEPNTEPSLCRLCGIGHSPDSVLGNIIEAAAVADLLRRVQPEIVFHLAAQSLVRRSYEEPVETYATNVMGTIHVLEGVRRTPSVRGVVVVTSDKCYENREWPWAYRETEAMGGYDPYSSSKGCTELVTSAWRRSFFAQAGAAAIASVRAGNVIGGGDWAADRLVPDCMRAFTAGRAVPIRSPRAVRPWQHVLEPLAGYLLIAEALLREPLAFADAWNFGPADEDTRPVGWVVSRLAQHWGDGAAWTNDQREHVHEAGVLRVDAAKARDRLGWRPRLPLDRALAWTAEWYRSVASGADAAALCLRQISEYTDLEQE